MTKSIDEIFSELRLHRFENALTLCNKLILENPGNPEAYELRGDCCYGLNNLDAAVDSYGSAIDFTDINIQGSEELLSILYTKSGLCKLKQNKPGDALQDFSRAINSEPLNHEAYIQRSKAYRSLKKYIEAFADAERAVTIEPESAAAYNARGICYMYLSKAAEALADFTTAISLKPDYAQAYHNRGNVYQKLLSDSAKAKQDWDTANALLQKKTAPKPKPDEIPDFSIGKIFNKNISPAAGTEENIQSAEQIELENEVAKVEIPEELKRLHYEIEGVSYPQESKPIEQPPHFVSDKPAQKLANIYLQESKGKPTVFKNILILAFLAAFIFLIIYGVYYSLVVSRKPQQETALTVKDENVLNEKLSDSTALTIPAALDSSLKSADMMIVRIDSGFCLQAGSFRDKQAAEARAKNLEEMGFDVNILDVQDSVKGTVYKVRFGRYESLNEIDSVIKIYNNE
ncbi:MAG TPA: tetratricopeptide repeat protein [Ignavibacteria bacterium]|nr:tetratricopeptide repeat protein [Ignavibacteria bacterium]